MKTKTNKIQRKPINEKYKTHKRVISVHLICEVINIAASNIEFVTIKGLTKKTKTKLNGIEVIYDFETLNQRFSDFKISLETFIYSRLIFVLVWHFS